MTVLRGRLRHNVDLNRLTSWRVGGPAKRLYEPADVEDLSEFLLSPEAVDPLLWLGLGSNVLIRDGGFSGSVIRLHRGLGSITELDLGRVKVGAGVPCARVARWAGQRGLGGAEFLAGIPGTLGGALAMNAGAWGGETWPLVESVEVINRLGQRQQRTPMDYQVSYREVSGHADEWFTSATLTLSTGADPLALQNKVRELLTQRAESQPTGLASGGSVFRNPPGDHAARLIEAAGLKGTVIGGARIAEKHANFIVHEGDASAADIEALIALAQTTVKSRFGIDLVPEVRIIGESVREH